MHLYVIGRGHNDSLKRWENDLSAQFFPVYDKNGKIKKNKQGQTLMRRLSVRPVQLYEIAFAEEELQNVLSCVCPEEYVEDRYSFIKRGLQALRKILKLKPVPKPTKINSLMQPNQIDKAVSIIPVGLKADARDNDGEEMI